MYFFLYSGYSQYSVSPIRKSKDNKLIHISGLKPKKLIRHQKTRKPMNNFYTKVIVDCIGHRYSRLRDDRSFFELLQDGGQCNPWIRELLIRKYLLRPLAKSAPGYDISDVIGIIDSACEHITGMHLCTARNHCPMLFCLRCLRDDIRQIMVAIKEEQDRDNKI